MSMLSRESFDLPESGPSEEEMQQLMTEKAHELFKVCDIEEKGFITKRDMQRLQSELPLSPEQLEHVFDSLDDDGNGFLTLEEFTDGFGSFLGIKSTEQPADMEMSKTYTDEHDIDPAEEEQTFKQMMKNVGATNLFDDESTIQGLWCRLKRDDPDMATHFEDFVYRVSNEIKKSKVDFDTLEGALRSRTTAHDEEVRKLYEEMEVQIKQEKEKILNEEKAKERQLREAMENEIYEKDKQLQELMAKHAEMEEKLGYLNTIETETKIENEKLAKDKDELEDMLMKSQSRLEESQSYISQLQQQQKDDKRERAKAAIQLSEGIAVERETLVKQLDMLKNMNRKLQDEKDEADLRRMEEPSTRRESPRRGNLERQGSTLGKYFNTKRIPKLSSCSESITEEGVEKDESGGLTDIDDGIECDDDIYIDGQAPAFIHHSVDSIHHSRTVPQSPWQQRMGKPADAADSGLDSVDGSSTEPVKNSERSTAATKELSKYSSTEPPRYGENAMVPQKEHVRNSERSTAVPEELLVSRYSSTEPLRYGETSTVTQKDSPSSFSPNSQRVQPVGADELTDSGIQTGTESTPLQRVFKVVFVGDSGVGKSSFIHRFCKSYFKASYAATIGVDFQIKNLPIENQIIVLQLWDTAGQERFRSITKQYFRKADGVVVMYDVTSETSFTNVRNWMTSVQDGASDDAVLVLLGNKNDLPEDDDTKAVKMKDGSRLADEYGTLFYETSALSGENVNNAMEALARVLKEKEDKEIEKSFRLEDEPKKKGCCS
ncbi:EF-hand calcium-binding domain-containing protein 4B-like isoform X2 [Mercenaria mercenaria]|uniref:EF-hand calcium-binding domain-containing protein 4B-like isoform X2 n=1 Tax=Mercenaria mercenaria TaxID=6596 RepID=UPI00234EF178|nr:EF-hand calcium-binding domain-containing protein 4B-like isoform X2 [Mercenaria mercenaria]